MFELEPATVRQPADPAIVVAAKISTSSIGLDRLDPRVGRLDRLDPRARGFDELNPRARGLDRLDPRVGRLDELDPPTFD